MKFLSNLFTSKSTAQVKLVDPFLKKKHYLRLFLLDFIGLIIINVIVYFHPNMMKNSLFVACYGFLCYCLAGDFWNFIKFKFVKKGDKNEKR